MGGGVEGQRAPNHEGFHESCCSHITSGRFPGSSSCHRGGTTRDPAGTSLAEGAGVRLHIVEGDLVPQREAIIPGHQIVGEIVDQGTAELPAGIRVGVSWIGGIDGSCWYCRRGLENLCWFNRRAAE